MRLEVCSILLTLLISKYTAFENHDQCTHEILISNISRTLVVSQNSEKQKLYRILNVQIQDYLTSFQHCDSLEKIKVSLDATNP